MAQRPSENGLGLAGFIVSLVGLVSRGLISPVGLVMSIVALKREPKGFAIAGLVLGILSSVWIVIGLAFGLFAAIPAALGIAQGVGGSGVSTSGAL